MLAPMRRASPTPEHPSPATPLSDASPLALPQTERQIGLCYFRIDPRLRIGPESGLARPEACDLVTETARNAGNDPPGDGFSLRIPIGNQDQGPRSLPPIGSGRE